MNATMAMDENRQVLTCTSCGHVWMTRKKGGGRKCPRCQSPQVGVGLREEKGVSSGETQVMRDLEEAANRALMLLERIGRGKGQIAVQLRSCLNRADRVLKEER